MILNALAGDHLPVYGDRKNVRNRCVRKIIESTGPDESLIEFVTDRRGTTAGTRCPRTN